MYSKQIIPADFLTASVMMTMIRTEKRRMCGDDDEYYRFTGTVDVSPT